MDKKTQDCHPIQGVKCEVINCSYNVKGQKCDAGEIEVGPGPADCCSETNCATFRIKDTY